MLWMMFISLVATLMGLLLSATLSTAEKVMSVVPLALIPQIMLAGVITKISNTLVEFLSYISISRWATEGFNCLQEEVAIPKMVITNKDNVFVAPPNKAAEPIIGQAKDSSGELIDSTANAVTEVQRNYHSDYIDRFGDLAGTLELDIYILAILGMTFFILIYVSIRRKDTIEIN